MNTIDEVCAVCHLHDQDFAGDPHFFQSLLGVPTLRLTVSGMLAD